MEPTVFKSISNYTVCNFFYIFFIVYAVLLGFIIVSGIATMLFVKMPAGQQIAAGVGYGIATARRRTLSPRRRRVVGLHAEREEAAV